MPGDPKKHAEFSDCGHAGFAGHCRHASIEAIRVKYAVGTLLCWMLGAQLHAENLYRCVDGRGRASYQSQACPVGNRTDRVIEFTPDPIAKRAMTPSRASRASLKTVSHQSANGSARGRSDKTADACDRAKAKRAAQLQKLGLKRTYDDLSRIDAAVWKVCQGS